MNWISYEENRILGEENLILGEGNLDIGEGFHDISQRFSSLEISFPNEHVCAQIFDMEIQYSQLKINHLSNTPSTKAAGGGIFSGVFKQGRQGTSQGQEDFELSQYLFFQQMMLYEIDRHAVLILLTPQGTLL